MLTLYSSKSPFKKKLTVIVIWLVALALGCLLIEFMLEKEADFILKTPFLIIGVFMIAGILLRCKIARGFTLITLYFLALFPLVGNFFLNNLFILLSLNNGLFTNLEVLSTNIVWGLLFIIPLYFFSNNKSMEIFYIESHPIEHIFFILGAMGLIFLSLQVFFS